MKKQFGLFSDIKKANRGFLKCFFNIYLSLAVFFPGIIYGQDSFFDDFDTTNQIGRQFNMITYPNSNFEPYSSTIINNELRVQAHKKEQESLIFNFPTPLNIKSHAFVSFKLRLDSSIKKDIPIIIELEDNSGKAINAVFKQVISHKNGYEEFSFSFKRFNTRIDLENIKAVKLIIFPKYHFDGTFFLDDFAVGAKAKFIPSINPIPEQNIHINTKERKVLLSGISNGFDASQTIRVEAPNPNPELFKDIIVNYSKDGIGTLIIHPAPNASGKAILKINIHSVDTNNIIIGSRIKELPIQITKNNAPTINQVKDIGMEAGTIKAIDLTGIDDGNEEAEQFISFHTTISNPDLLDVPTIEYTQGFSNGLLLLKAKKGASGEALISLITKDDGGIDGGGNNQNTITFKVKIFEKYNNPPKINPIQDQFITVDSKEQIIELSGINDGDQGDQVLTLTAESSDSSVIEPGTISIIEGTQKALFKITPKSEGKAIITITVNDKASAGFSNPIATSQIHFKIVTRPVPKTSLTENFQNFPMAGKWKVEHKHEITFKQDALHVKIQKESDSKDHWLGFWFNFDVLDISKNPRVGVKVRNNIAASPEEFNLRIYLVDVNNNYNVQSPVDVQVQKNALGEYVFDFQDKLIYDLAGNKIDLKRINKILFNAAPGGGFKSEFEITEVNIGDVVGPVEKAPNKIQINPIPNFLIPVHNGKQKISIAGIKIDNNETTTISASSDNASITGSLDITKIDNSNAILSFTPLAIGNSIITIIVNGENSFADTLSFNISIIEESSLSNSKVLVNLQRKFQPIEGFGAFQIPHYLLKEGIEDLGLNIIRTQIDSKFEAINDNCDPNVINKDGFDISALTYLETLKKLKGKNIKVIASVWSPPGWMKVNFSESVPAAKDAENILNKNYYEEFIEFIIAYIKVIKEEAGIDIYAISFQNNPENDKHYHSCQYSSVTYKNLLVLLNNKLKELGLPTKILGPETTSDVANTAAYLKEVLKGGETLMDIGALKLYNKDGRNEGTLTSEEWHKIKDILQMSITPIPLWVTEASGELGSFPTSGLRLAENLSGAIKDGEISAWCYWSFQDENNLEQYSLMSGDRFLSKYYAAKNFTKYIPVGAYHVETFSDNSDLLTNAFLNPDSSVTIILINNSTIPTVASLNFESSDNYKIKNIYRTAENLNCQEIIDPKEGMLIPGESITTYILNHQAPSIPSSSAYSKDLVVYPVPARQEINVEVPSPKYYFITIIDLLGKEVGKFRIEDGETKIKINLGKYDRGLFLVKAEGEGEKMLQKKIVLLD